MLEQDKSIGESLIRLKHQMPWLMNNANEAFSTGSLFKALTAAYSRSFFFIPIFLSRSVFALLWVLRVCLAAILQNVTSRAFPE